MRPDSDHARSVRRFVDDYCRARARLDAACARGDADRRDSALDEVRRLERRVIIIPEGR